MISDFQRFVVFVSKNAFSLKHIFNAYFLKEFSHISKDSSSEKLLEANVNKKARKLRAAKKKGKKYKKK